MNWISVKDQEPKIGELVIIYNDNHPEIIAGIYFGQSMFETIIMDKYAEYWMPLPKSPTE